MISPYRSLLNSWLDNLMFLPYVKDNNLTILNCVSKAWFRLSEGKLCTPRVENYVSGRPFGHEPMFCMHTWLLKKKFILLDDSKNKWIKIYKFCVRNKLPHLPACFHLSLIACLLSCVLLCVYKALSFLLSRSYCTFTCLDSWFVYYCKLWTLWAE